MSSPILMDKALSDFSRLLVAIKDFKDDDLVRLDRAREFPAQRWLVRDSA